MSDQAHALRVRPGEGAQSDLLAPSVGIFAPSVAVGELVSPGQTVGTIDVLGILSDLIVPAGAGGRVARCMGDGRARVPVQYGDPLLGVSIGSVEDLGASELSASAGVEGTLSFMAPMSGRFYCRPAPAEPPFVKAGDAIQHGQTVGLLEVMKTFNRLVYQGDALPTRATVERVVPDEGADVVRGDVILALVSATDE